MNAEIFRHVGVIAFVRVVRTHGSG